MLDTIDYSTHLLVMRHGQAKLNAVSDHQRPLSGEGEMEVLQSAQFIAAVLSSSVDTYIDILVSDSLRTKSTWALIKKYLETQNIRLNQFSVSYRSDLYLASSTKLQSIISDVQVRVCEQRLTKSSEKELDPPLSHIILMISHNPGCSELIYDLVGKSTSLKTSQIAHLSQGNLFGIWALQALVSQNVI